MSSFPFLTQVFPLRVHLVNEGDFLSPYPALQFFFTLYSRIDIVGDFIIDELEYTILTRKPREEMITMFVKTAGKIICYANV